MYERETEPRTTQEAAAAAPLPAQKHDMGRYYFHGYIARSRSKTSCEWSFLRSAEPCSNGNGMRRKATLKTKLTRRYNKDALLLLVLLYEGTSEQVDKCTHDSMASFIHKTLKGSNLPSTLTFSHWLKGIPTTPKLNSQSPEALSPEALNKKR